MNAPQKNYLICGLLLTYITALSLPFYIGLGDLTISTNENQSLDATRNSVSTYTSDTVIPWMILYLVFVSICGIGYKTLIGHMEKSAIKDFRQLRDFEAHIGDLYSSVYNNIISTTRTSTEYLQQHPTLLSKAFDIMTQVRAIDDEWKLELVQREYYRSLCFDAQLCQKLDMEKYRRSMDRSVALIVKVVFASETCKLLTNPEQIAKMEDAMNEEKTILEPLKRSVTEVPSELRTIVNPALSVI